MTRRSEKLIILIFSTMQSIEMHESVNEKHHTLEYTECISISNRYFLLTENFSLKKKK